MDPASDFNLIGDTSECGNLGQGSASITGVDPRLAAAARYGHDRPFLPHSRQRGDRRGQLHQLRR
ncbi:MAG: hypothetical protein U5K43_01790 [Halofilum sp. (in: g-proteobacteria)]|nr:hypothetical protein [Halofilum sp. (in: g-proteobacteria)]